MCPAGLCFNESVLLVFVWAAFVEYRPSSLIFDLINAFIKIIDEWTLSTKFAQF
jgi:hypothetical protein